MRMFSLRWLVVAMSVAGPAEAADPASPVRSWTHPVMTRVPHYGVAESKARLAESFDGMGMKDALYHLALPFWMLTEEPGFARVGPPEETGEDEIAELRDWGHADGVRVLLCVYNAKKTRDWPLATAKLPRQT